MQRLSNPDGKTAGSGVDDDVGVSGGVCPQHRNTTVKVILARICPFMRGC